MQCPCHSGKDYSQCCAPFHEGALPPTALDLMRSRYSAYALKKIDYILATNHPKNPMSRLPPKRAYEELSHFAANTSFDGLTILSHEPNELFSTVTFRAILSQNGQDASFTEKSTFEKIGGKWYYLSGENQNSTQGR